MRVAVLGAGGTTGSAIVAALAVATEVDGLSLLDLSGERARAVAAEHGGDKAQAAAVDAADPQALYLALEGHQLLVNAAGSHVALAAMDACLAADCSYLDLDGAYHVARDQYRLHDAFAQRGLVAALGCGAAPGLTNVMAAHAARGLSQVDRVRCASAGLDAAPPMVVRGGEHVAVDPPTDGGQIAFPEPVGRRGSVSTLHAEVLTLAASLGAEACDFRLSPDPEPREVLHGAQYVEVTGVRDEVPVTVVVTALTVPDTARGLGGGIVVAATVASTTALLFARGGLRAAGFGVHAPEGVLTPETLFATLEERGCTFVTTTQTQEVRLS